MGSKSVVIPTVKVLYKVERGRNRNKGKMLGVLDVIEEVNWGKDFCKEYGNSFK